jgi:hypothetical protein
MIVKLTFVNRTAACDGEVADYTYLEVSRASVKHIMAWYGGYYAGDDYDVLINGRAISKDKNGEFEPLTIDI